ncbi:AbrB family transcriptional regulator [Synechococcus sp. CB0101]|jgi:antitoxin VapB|nr:AbrB family transcriptional regulator [Synechococcus sp. CB0101]
MRYDGEAVVRARLFMSGRSQALRLPARLRLRGPDVEIEPIGDGLWVQPCADPSEGLGDWLERFYADHPPLPVEFLEDRQDQQPQERDWA